MSVDLVEFVRARLDEDVWWAREASRCRGRYTEGGEHWRWEDVETDQPVTPDPASDEFIKGAGWNASLRSVERYPFDAMPGVGPHIALSGSDEVEAAVGGHIARHDPARVLAQVEALRQIVDWLDGSMRPKGAPPGVRIDTVNQGYRRALQTLASIWRDHPQYDPSWAPEEART